MQSPASIRLLFIALPVLVASCAKPAYEARGYASYIADQYAGQFTTSGAIYQPQGWTAAHNTLPFGTVVTVKNNYNGRTVNVTVNDRFPSYPNRVINLSRRAAEYIQIPYHQLSDVTVTAKTVAAAPVASYNAPAPAYYNNTPPPHSYSTPPRAAYKAPAPKKTVAVKKKPAPKPYYSAPASTYRKPTAIPPAGAGTMAPPAGLPPPPPGYENR